MKAGETGLTQKLEKFSRKGGADLFGVADLGLAGDFIASQCPSWVGAFPRAVSLGMQVNAGIAEQHDPNEPRHLSMYWFHVYEVVSPALNFLAYDTARWLTAKGFKAFPIPASMPYDPAKLMGVFSHKLAAHLAGLGWIGKSCLLLTDRFGPRVRFVSVLTDAPLETGSPLDRPCGKCRACVDACPAKAFTGAEFHPEEPREVRFDVFKCSEFRKAHPCGVCVSTCPRGKRSRNSGKEVSG